MLRYIEEHIWSPPVEVRTEPEPLPPMVLAAAAAMTAAAAAAAPAAVMAVVPSPSEEEQQQQQQQLSPAWPPPEMRQGQPPASECGDAAGSGAPPSLPYPPGVVLGLWALVVEAQLLAQAAQAAAAQGCSLRLYARPPDPSEEAAAPAAAASPHTPPPRLGGAGAGWAGRAERGRRRCHERGEEASHGGAGRTGRRRGGAEQPPLGAELVPAGSPSPGAVAGGGSGGGSGGGADAGVGPPAAAPRRRFPGRGDRPTGR